MLIANVRFYHFATRKPTFRSRPTPAKIRPWSVGQIVGQIASRQLVPHSSILSLSNRAVRMPRVQRLGGGAGQWQRPGHPAGAATGSTFAAGSSELPEERPVFFICQS
jgi:hypothetical protein